MTVFLGRSEVLQGVAVNMQRIGCTLDDSIPEVHWEDFGDGQREEKGEVANP